MLLRHGSWSQIFHFAVHHLEETFNFPFRVYSGLGPHVIIDLLRTSHAVPEIVVSRGHEVNDLPVGPLSSDCISAGHSGRGTSDRFGPGPDKQVFDYRRPKRCCICHRCLGVKTPARCLALFAQRTTYRSRCRQFLRPATSALTTCLPT